MAGVPVYTPAEERFLRDYPKTGEQCGECGTLYGICTLRVHGLRTVKGDRRACCSSCQNTDTHSERQKPVPRSPKQLITPEIALKMLGAQPERKLAPYPWRKVGANAMGEHIILAADGTFVCRTSEEDYADLIVWLANEWATTGEQE